MAKSSDRSRKGTREIPGWLTNKQTVKVGVGLKILGAMLAAVLLLLLLEKCTEQVRSRKQKRPGRQQVTRVE